MIEAIRSIGESTPNSGGDSLNSFIENPNSNGKYKRVLLVVLKKTNGTYIFDRVESEEYKGEKYINYYLYKKGSPNGTDLTPTSKVAASLEKTFQIKFLKWFENYEEYELPDRDKNQLKEMKVAIESKKDEILAALEEKYAQKKKDENYLITLAIEEDDVKYIGEILIFQEILRIKGRDKYYRQKSKGESLGKNAICSVCRREREEVYGCAVPWKFHTFDKPGFIAGGFNFEDSWKDTPICFDCAKYLEIGKKYAEENLDFNFYGFRYLLIPKLIVNGDYRDILNILGDEHFRKEVRLSKDVKDATVGDEKEILELVAEQENSFSANFIFYKKDNSSYRILLSIEDILPSRLRYLFDIKDKVDNNFKSYNILVTDKKETLQFNFGFLRDFFPYESQNRTFDKTFLEVVNKIFVGNEIDYNLIIGAIMKKVRDAFSKENLTNYSTLRGFILLHYIKDLDLFQGVNKEERDMKENLLFGMEGYESIALEERIKAFFKNNEAFFNSDARKAVFLEGVLTQFLLNIQYVDKKSTPFRAKLQGLKLNEKLVKRLLPEIQNKLEEYDKNYFKELEYLISQYFILAGDKWKIADDDLSFYFVLGMDTSRLFKNAQNEELKEEKNE